MNKKIIDVSAWQGYIDWEKVSKEVELAILRASCGKNKDDRFDQFARGCTNNGIPFGVYHYLMPLTIAQARTEADLFYNTAKKYKPAFWVLDVEYPKLLWTNGECLPMNPNLFPIVQAFYKRLKERVGNDAKIVYYGGESVYAKPYGDLGRIPWSWLWIANYNGKPGHAMCKLHQYSSSGKINGIKTRVDMNNLFNNATIEDLIGVVEKPKEESTNDASKDVAEEKTEEKYVVTRLLKQGSIGLQVRWLQNRLNEEGFKCGNVDGIFGTDTLAAVKKYQKSKGLKVDGIAGKKTVEALGGSYRG